MLPLGYATVPAGFKLLSKLLKIPRCLRLHMLCLNYKKFCREPELIAHQSVPKLFQLILQKQIFDPTLKET